MKMLGSVVSLSFIFPQSSEDTVQRRKGEDAPVRAGLGPLWSSKLPFFLLSRYCCVIRLGHLYAVRSWHVTSMAGCKARVNRCECSGWFVVVMILGTIKFAA